MSLPPMGPNARPTLRARPPPAFLSQLGAWISRGRVWTCRGHDQRPDRGRRRCGPRDHARLVRPGIARLLAAEAFAPEATIVAVDYDMCVPAVVAAGAALFLVDDREQYLANRHRSAVRGLSRRGGHHRRGHPGQAERPCRTGPRHPPRGRPGGRRLRGCGPAHGRGRASGWSSALTRPPRDTGHRGADHVSGRANRGGRGLIVPDGVPGSLRQEPDPTVRCPSAVRTTPSIRAMPPAASDMPVVDWRTERHASRTIGAAPARVANATSQDI